MKKWQTPILVDLEDVAADCGICATSGTTNNNNKIQ
ncbi:hypothetical protein J2Z79_001446 [Symbiobacterium terraclitae]|uniref:Uncharacterized protein n=1 Tax=Symbiobacterium terraclitae TaxID=557451 RepID=A0ABS4JR89_9FIRM|nr:hypothetical protein [Symbiobacterium terraclitae]